MNLDIQNIFLFFGKEDMSEFQQEIWWANRNNKIEIFYNCSDLFMWACADSERITLDDLVCIRQAYDDLKQLGNYAEVYTLELWCSRKRNCRLQVAWFKREKMFDDDKKSILNMMYSVNPDPAYQYGTPEFYARKIVT